MNGQVDLISEVLKVLPEARVTATQSGLNTWVDIAIDAQRFVMQITPYDGVGVSQNDEIEETDFCGHANVFKDFEEALVYVYDQCRK